MAYRSAAAQNFVDGEIGRALTRAGLPHDHAIHAVLDAEAQIEGVRDAAVRCQGESLDSRIDQLRHEARFSHTFPQPTAKVAKSDMRTMSMSFNDIVAGRVRVE